MQPDSSDIQHEINAGDEALRTADWQQAKVHYESALRLSESPEVHDALGIALWWLNEIRESHQHRIRAYNLFKEQGQFGRAARIACWLGREQVFLDSNTPAMQGWFARARRLLTQQPAGKEQAWCALYQASMLENPHELEQTAGQILHDTAALDDPNLEAFALALHGLALVTLGHVTEGIARLDEAMTMTIGGEVNDYMVISEVFCLMLSTCEVAGDWERSDHWCRIASAFADRHRCPFLSAYCRTSYGSLMTTLGRWYEAETALTEAIQAFESGHRGLRIHAMIRLADLWINQGKLEQAEELLSGLEDQSAAIIPLARLHLNRNQPLLARTVLLQALPVDQAYTLNHLPVLFLLIETLLQIKDYPAARHLLTMLNQLCHATHSTVLVARMRFLEGRFQLHSGDFSAARGSFNQVLSHLQSYQQSLLAGQARLMMAQSLSESDPPGAIAWAKAALATFVRVDAARDVAIASAFLRQLGVGADASPHLRQPLTRRETEVVTLLSQGLSNREIADRLVISSKTVEHHVSRILDKLGLRSRAEVAAFVASGKLATFIHNDHN